MVACAVQTAVETVGGKWKPGILFRLQDGPRRPSELLREMPWISERVLLRALRELEAAGVVVRRAGAGFPRRTDYALTAHGEALRPLLAELGRWGGAHLARAM
jgi:DNA-binding HxlR family transcriptional regulator